MGRCMIEWPTGCSVYITTGESARTQASFLMEFLVPSSPRQFGGDYSAIFHISWTVSSKGTPQQAVC